MEIILLARVCVCLSMQPQSSKSRAQFWSTKSSGQATDPWPSGDGRGGYRESPGAAQLPWGARGWWWEPPVCFSPGPRPRAALGAQRPWGSLQVPIPPRRDSAPVFRALHILLMT